MSIIFQSISEEKKKIFVEKCSQRRKGARYQTNKRNKKKPKARIECKALERVRWKRRSLLAEMT